MKSIDTVSGFRWCERNVLVCFYIVFLCKLNKETKDFSSINLHNTRTRSCFELSVQCSLFGVRWSILLLQSDRVGGLALPLAQIIAVTLTLSMERVGC
mgnify:CR=1 FL=1